MNTPANVNNIPHCDNLSLENLPNEIWKPIKGCEETYLISNFGRVKSLLRNIILKQEKDQGYRRVSLQRKNKRVHQLVAIAFLGHIKCGLKLVVNHKDHIRSNNHVDNLEIITGRKNSGFTINKSTSKYIGVSKVGNRWRASIKYNGKTFYLGSFKTELQAHNAYEKRLEKFKQKEEAHQARLEALKSA